jgi:ribose transport system ATP-binding protein
VIDRKAENNIGRHYAHRLNIRLNRLASKALHLSGGTQQKLILSRWLASRCRLLLLDEPTRGVDVSSRLEFYHLLNELSRRGTAMILVSSNLAEILSLSDHIMVLRRGQVMAVRTRSGTSPANLLALANGGMQV